METVSRKASGSGLRGGGGAVRTEDGRVSEPGGGEDEPAAGYPRSDTAAGRALCGFQQGPFLFRLSVKNKKPKVVIYLFIYFYN